MPTKAVRNGSKMAPMSLPRMWLESMPKAERVLKTPTVLHETFETGQQRQYEEQRDTWSREGVFWCKNTGTWETRREGHSSQPVSGHWFYSKHKMVLEMYGDVRQPPVETEQVVFYKT
jgi:hypothetical protein